MTSVRKTGPGTYRIEGKKKIHDPEKGGKVERRWSLTVHTGSMSEKKAAAAVGRIAEKAQFDIDAGRSPVAEVQKGLRVLPAGMTVAEWAPIWLKAQNYEESWKAKAERILAYHVLPEFGGQELDEVENIAVQGWLTGLSKRKSRRTGRKLAPATVAGIWSVFKPMMAAAVANRLCDRDPCAGLKAPKVPKRGTVRPAHVLSPAQVVALADELLVRANGGRGRGRRTAYEDLVRRRWRLLTLTLAWTGLRWEEVGGLRTPGHVRLLARPPYLAVTEDGPIKTTGKAGGRYHGDPKSQAGIRDVAIIQPLAGEIGDFCGHGLPYVFGTRNGTPCHYGDYRAAFKAAARRLGHPEWHIHDLRHSHATWIQHCALAAVKERLGHEPDVTGIYTHADDAGRAEILRVLARLWVEGHEGAAGVVEAAGGLMDDETSWA